ncbi:16762_t:CDS:2 [Acaulospora colombiana]|uniref:16762_t:CDS:1 n=1 Tax=Acaulospora colombiana TaxID=27376 RepID=A0ACA9MKF5_9GLOM|nr:16762_t:CDS:2 [Acaulospora colombiana]
MSICSLAKAKSCVVKAFSGWNMVSYNRYKACFQRITHHR